LAALDSDQLQLLAPEFELPYFIDLAEKCNADMALAKAKVEVARLEVVKAQAAHLPTVDWVVQKSLSKSENLINPLASYLSFQSGIQVNLPLFSGGYTESSIRQAQAYFDRERENLEQTRRTLALQIRKEYQNMTEGLLKFKALEQALVSAKQLVVSSRKSIQAGVRTQTDLLNALQREAEAQRDLAQIRYQYLIAQQKLTLITGGTALSASQSINKILVTDSKPLLNP
jgi:outer membrane protein/protease secretion system outer membrane protein